MSERWSVSVEGGKYTAIGEPGKGLTFLRHGEPWPAAEDWRYANALWSLAAELRQARRALDLVVRLGRGGDPKLLERAAAYHEDYGVGFVDFALSLEGRLEVDEVALQKSERPVSSNASDEEMIREG